MNERYYKEKLSEFVNHELPSDERQAIGEHLLVCAECRAEHDLIKLGAMLAQRLKQADAPVGVWNKIEIALDKNGEKVSRSPRLAFFGSPVLAAMAGLLLVFGLLTAAVYFGFFGNNSPGMAKDQIKPANAEMPQVISTTNEPFANQNTNQTAETNSSNITGNPPNNPQIADSNIKITPKNNAPQPKENFSVQANLPSWNVETLAGMPKIGNSATSEKLAVGEFLETDANSRAKVQVADIGNVEIAPNSRVKLVGTKTTEHRLALEKGEIKAKIYAPPRLFIVDTPTATAVDLGCEYTLEVDRNGDSRLHVTSGFVALENGKLSSIVPAGAFALTRKGKGIGTPYAEDSSAAFQKAVYQFDFENGGAAALETIIKEASLYDSLTLWHLLVRVPRAERGKVFNALSNFVEPPANVTVEGVLRLDKKMLDAWWKEVETVWFG